MEFKLYYLFWRFMNNSVSKNDYLKKDTQQLQMTSKQDIFDVLQQIERYVDIPFIKYMCEHGYVTHDYTNEPYSLKEFMDYLIDSEHVDDVQRGILIQYINANK